MKILVAVKRVIDFQVKIRVQADGRDIDKNNVKMSMNPFDEIAIEEAVRIKEQGIASEVLVVSVGEESTQETLRHALALGADRAQLIKTEKNLQPLEIANLLKLIVEKEGIDLVLLGKQAIDNDCNQTGQMLAGLLNWPQATFASKIQFQQSNVMVTREVDGGLETLQLKLPAVITTDLRLNQPRFASLPNILKSKTKPLAQLSLEEFNMPNIPRLTRLHVEPPAQREAGPILSSIKELMDILKNNEGVLP